MREAANQLRAAARLSERPGLTAWLYLHARGYAGILST